MTSQKKEIEIVDQKDRSLTVMIPRAKYHPSASTSPLMNYTTFDARKPSVPSVAEAKLLNYLDASATSKVRNIHTEMYRFFHQKESVPE